MEGPKSHPAVGMAQEEPVKIRPASKKLVGKHTIEALCLEGRYSSHHPVASLASILAPPVPSPYPRQSDVAGFYVAPNFDAFGCAGNVRLITVFLGHGRRIDSEWRDRQAPGDALHESFGWRAQRVDFGAG